MKILGLVLALVCLAGGAVVADTASFDVNTGWNLYAVPIAPYDATPASVWANVFAAFTASYGPRGVLTGMEFGNGTSYDPTDPGSFGGIMLGAGYWVKPKAKVTGLVVTGFPDGFNTDGTTATMCDMWISLPGNSGGTNGAWHLIGQPFKHDTLATDVKFTDGTQVLNWSDAVAANWVYNVALGCDTAGFGGQFRVSYTDSVVHEDDRFRANHGYQLRTKKANLAMIIPATPVAP